VGDDTIHYIDADEALKMQIAEEWSDVVAQHMHLVDGFSVVAVQSEKPIGLISVYWKKLLPSLPETCEGYIDIIEVHRDFRRKGIATRLIELSVERARAQGAYRLRAWSSEDKTEAISMWKALEFGLYPATVYPRGQEVRGYFVTKTIREQTTHK